MGLAYNHNSLNSREIIFMAAPRPEDKHQDIRQEKEQGSSERAKAEANDRMARSAADASERAARIGLEVVQRNNEAAQQVWDASAKMASRLTHQSANQLGRIFGLSGDEAQKTLQDTVKNIDVLNESNGVVLSASKDLTREWLDITRSVMEHSMSHSDGFLRCRTPQDFFELQTRLMRENLNAVLNGTKRMAEISARAAQEATAKMSNQNRPGA
jgi:phasin family protein